MNKITSLLTLLLLIVGLNTASAAEAGKFFYLVSGGKTTTFALSDSPVITFSGRNIIVACKNQTVSASLANVEDYQFASPTGIANIKTGAKANSKLVAGTAYFTGLKPQETVAVFTFGGQLVRQVKASADGEAEVNTLDLPSGEYIIKGGATAIKFVNK